MLTPLAFDSAATGTRTAVQTGNAKFEVGAKEKGDEESY